MADYSRESADDVKYKKKIVHPVFMKELQNAWNWSTAMDLNSRKTDTKQHNKNIDFYFRTCQQYEMEKRSKINVFEWYFLQWNSSGKKCQRTEMFIDHFLSY